jgi:two-component system sensor histidine kinase BaeS
VTAPEASDNTTEARGDDFSAIQRLKTIYVICTAIICGVTFYFNKVTFENSFQHYRSTVELHRLEPLARNLEGLYYQNRNWNFLSTIDIVRAMAPGPQDGGRPRPTFIDRAMSNIDGQPYPPEPPGDGQRPGPSFAPPAPPPHIMDLSRRVAIYEENQHIWGPEVDDKVTMPLWSSGRKIGSIRLAPGSSPDAEADNELMHRSQDAYLGSSAAAFLALLILGQYLLTRAEAQKKKLTVALLQLKGAERKAILEGEDAELTAAFNSLANSLAELDSGHRQWVADTSHELRTPIAVLRAQVEAFQDGIQELTPRNLAVLHSEIMALSKLVDDLHWLAKYDVGQIKTTAVPVDINQTLQDVLESFEERREAKEIKLENLVPAEEKLIVIADASRLRQVLTNLTENSLRYTNKGGTMRISHVVNGPLLELYFDDTEPGVPDELLPRLFDRFFRVESSRARTMGGSGLGLAICLNNMQMLGGKIEASHSSMGGLRIELTLPMVEAHT